MDKEQAKALLKKHNVTLVNLQFSDIMGHPKSITLPTDKFIDNLDGMWFDGSSIEGFSRIFESDMYLKPDMNTFFVIPWLQEEENGKCNTGGVICDVFTPDGKPYECDPRQILKKVLKEAEDMGYTFNTGPELEFFLFKKGDDGKIKNSAGRVIETHDEAQYFDMIMDRGFDVRREMVYTLQKMGIDVEASHHEVAPGQHEIDFKYGDALTTADKVVIMKYALRSIAHKHGLQATFMPKPITGVNGTGMHVHQSLADAKTGKNLFFDANDEYKLSKIAYSYLAGQMKHVKGMSGILNPIVNSYKRLVPGYEAATYICWARINRSALIRVPKYSPGKESGTRLEIRNPDTSANPYLAFAVLLKAGLDGIKNNMTPPKPVEENVFHMDDKELEAKGIDVLPRSLYDALLEMKKNPLVKSVMGEDLFNKYYKAKIKEWDEFRLHVTDWELNRYLERV